MKHRKADIQAVLDRDPATRSRLEAVLCCPGYRAVRRHRRAHFFYKHGMRLIARMISERTRRLTGIDIHPGAQIGEGFFIDHGTGVVIGETTVIGKNCSIFQNATLGGTGKDTGKRHPTLGDNVMVSAGAKVLGPFRVGDNARVAAGAVVLDAVPDNATAVGVPARIVRGGGKRVMDNSTLDQIHVADPVAQEMCRMRLEIERLHGELNSCRREKSNLTAQKAEKNKEE
mgnify:CR=1 FL=1